SLSAQTIVSGDIQGTVTDVSGAVVPNATLTATNDATNESYTSKTSGTGFYRFNLLKPGTYTIMVSGSGLQSTSRKVTVGLGRSTPANFELAVAGSNQTVEVVAETPLIQTDNGNISTSYDATQIAGMPNPGNDITYVAQTAPGVAMNTGG